MSAERGARILIVDDEREVARVLRAGLEVMKRGYEIVDVPSGEEALLETGRLEFDLAILDYRLPGMSGVELTKRIRKQIPHIKVLLITGHDVRKVKEDAAGLDILDILAKPINVKAFTEAVEKALHGFAEAEVAPPVEDRLGAIPDFDEAPVAARLSAIHQDLRANAVLFVDRQGAVRITRGAVDRDLRFEELAVLLARNFTTTAEISGYLGDQPSTAVHYYDGNRNDIFALSAGAHFFVAIVFPGGSQKQMGWVLRSKPTVQEIAQLVGGDEKEALPGVTPEAEAAPEPVEAEPEPVELKTEPVAEEVEGSAFEEVDLAGLDLGELDKILEGEIGDANDFWEAATKDVSLGDEDALTLDEAIELGLIPEDLQD